MTDIQKLAPITHTGTQTIVTSRLVLRPFQMADAGDTFVWASNPRVVRFLSYTPHADLSETKSVLKDWVSSYQSPAVYNWAIVYDHLVIGNIAVVSQDDACHACHLGRQIDEPYWNQGIMTEAAAAVVRYLFEKVGYDRIESGHHTRNIDSGRVMEKIGMKREGALRRYCYQKDGSIGDKNIWAILKSDWEERQEKLKNKSL